MQSIARGVVHHAVLATPIAVVRLAESGPSANELVADAFVRLDGSDSYDTDAPSDPTLIAAYDWFIESTPAATTSGDVDSIGDHAAVWTIVPPVEGIYSACLRVTSTAGVESGATCLALKVSARRDDSAPTSDASPGCSNIPGPGLLVMLAALCFVRARSALR